jgi:apolipoprotein N-acyltransferase
LSRLKNHLLRWLPPVVAGVVWTLAFPNAGVAGLGWAVPALVLFSAQSWNKRPFLGGYVAGLIGWLGMIHWLLFIPFPAGAVAGWLALSAYVALFPALWAWLCLRPLRHESHSMFSRLASLPWGHRQLWALGCAATWTGLELVQGRFLGGFPWNPLGVSQFRLTPLVQLAAWTGVAGLSFLMVWFSTCLLGAVAVLVSTRGKRRALSGEILLPMLAIVGVFVWGMNRIARPDEGRRTLRLALVQPSIPQLLIWNPNESTNRFRTLLDLTRSALTTKPDAVIWPEASLPSLGEEDFAALKQLIMQGGVPLIFGADDVEITADGREQFYNAAFVLGPDGRLVARYRKRQLVIFGEYIPFERWLPFMKWLTPIGSGFSSGTERGLFPIGTNGVTAGPLICFEDMFAAVARSSVSDEIDFLLNLTNDGWFGESSEQWQQAASAAFRAVENRRPLVRCTNNGLTCWIDEFGRFHQILTDERGSIYAPGVMLAEVVLP